MRWTPRLRLHGLVGIIALVWFGAGVFSLEGSLADWGDDWAHYASQARGVAEGRVDEELALARFRNSWSTEAFGPAVAPWGFPLLLSPVYALTDGDIASLKVPGCVFYALFLGALYLLTEGRLGDRARVLLVLVFALDPTLFRFQNQLLSDIPFLFFSTASLLMIDRGIYQRRYFIRPSVDACILGGLVALACMTRGVGFLLLLTLAWAQGLRWLVDRPPDWFAYLRERRVEVLVYGVTLLLLGVVSTLLPTAESGLAAQLAYLGEESGADLRARYAERVVAYAAVIAEFFRSEAIPPAVEMGLALVTVALAILGALRRIRQDAVLLIYGALYFGLLVVTDFFDGLRYLFPLLPLLLYFSLAGLAPLSRVESAPRRVWSRPLASVYASVIVAVFLGHLGLVFGQPAKEPPSFVPWGRDGSSMLTEIRSRTEADDVIAFLKPRAMTYLTGRPSIVVTRFDQLFDGRADYLVLLMGPVRDQLPVPHPEWDAHHGEFELVYQNPRYLILELSPVSRSAAAHSSI